MSQTDDEFLQALRATFRLEAEEHLQTIATGALELERAGTPEARRETVSRVFRAAHSLKGAARAVDLTEIESLCESLEDRFAAWKRQDLAPPAEDLDTIHRALDAIGALLAVPLPPARPAAPPIPTADPGQAAVRPAADAAPSAPDPAAAAPSGQTVRVAVSKLEARLLEAEEMLTAKLTAARRAQDFRELATHVASWGRQWRTAEPHARALRRSLARGSSGAAVFLPSDLTRVLEFLEANVQHLRALGSRVAALARTSDQDGQAVGKLVDDLLDGVKTLLLLPFGTLAGQFPRLVRDLCRDLGKEADLVIRGEDVEIDKRVLEEMKDPLVHLLRNSVDHGVELPEARLRAGKPPRGTITVAASRVEGGKVDLRVADDGAGIDAANVRGAAVRRGSVSVEDGQRLSEAEVHDLIFQAEISTSPILTRLSGRGLGLAIVREQTEKLGGTVTVDSRPGLGTEFSIVVPSALATFRGLVVEAAHRLFVVPTQHVARVTRASADDVRTVEGRDTITSDGRVLPLVRLADVLDLPVAAPAGQPQGATPVLVLGMGDQRIAFGVDAILDEREVLVKPLRRPLSRVRHIAGATVLGSGAVAPILHVTDLIASARKTGGASREAPRAEPAQGGARTILVAEDSITSRMLIKGILEGAGYTVRTAVDGIEAFSLLQEQPCDLVVSDVEMPRLDGFALTARIRADRRLAELPVVLVTALESPQDRERGIDVRADAYVVKSRFDQSDLLDTIRRLL